MFKKSIIFYFYALMLLWILSANAEEQISLVCSFQQGVGFNPERGSFLLDEDLKRFSFQIPSKWLSKFPPKQDRSSLMWKNLTGGWDGEAEALLDRQKVHIIETNTSDNNFYVTIWLDRLNSKGAAEALYHMNGHTDLPKSYEASSLRYGYCQFR